MYSFKEKAKFLRELGHTSHAEKDLHLLKQLDPRSNLIEAATNFPSRYAEKVLYALLDLTTIEEIRKNRRDIDNQKENNETPGEKSDLSKTVSGTEGTNTEEQSVIQAKKDPQDNQPTEQTGNPVKEQDPTDQAKEEPEQLATEKAQLEEQLEETEAERDEAIEEKEDLEEQLEEKETELETVKSELEEEKKSEETPTPKAPAKRASSKKKKSTPK